MNTHSLLIPKTIFITSLLFVGGNSMAASNSDLKKASSIACDKIKMCIKEEAAKEQDLSPQMAAMIDNIAEQSCKSLYEINQLTAQDDLIEPIIECYEAMADSSCDDLKEGNKPQACVVLEEKVKDL